MWNSIRPGAAAVGVLAFLPACGGESHLKRDVFMGLPYRYASNIPASDVLSTTEFLDKAAKLDPDDGRWVEHLAELARQETAASARTQPVLAGGRHGGILFDALRAARTAVDVHAHNLANAKTLGFKRLRAEFADTLYEPLTQGAPEEKALAPPVVAQRGSGVRLVGTTRFFDQGPLEFTHRELDWAIEGEGFFRLDRNGVRLYTRAGNFHRDSEGSVITADGFKLDPPVTIPGNITNLTIQPDGRVMGWDPSNPQIQQEIGRIYIVRFVNPNGLRAVGDNLYEENQDSAGIPIEGNPGDGAFGCIRDRCLEQSNVDVIRELVDLIQAKRWSEMILSAIATVHASPGDRK